MNKALLLFVTALIGFGGVTAMAGEKGEGFFLEKMSKELNLTKEQQEKFKAIHAGSRDQMKAKREAMKSAHDDLEKALQSSVTDDEVRAKFSVLQKQQDEFAKARFEKILAVRAILTPEQRAKMRAMPDHHGQKRGKMGRKGRKGSPSDEE